MNVQDLLSRYSQGNDCAPEDRDASFDYCFNYFRGFYESGTKASLADDEHLETSCMQLGFYLASWGMYRGNTYLSKHSSRALVGVIKCLANAADEVWSAEPENYSEHTWEVLEPVMKQLYSALPTKPATNEIQMSETLMTKILLGTTGCVPAIDTYVRSGLTQFGIRQSLSSQTIQKIGDLYKENAASFAGSRRSTLNFLPSQEPIRLYPQARVLDMALFQAGCLPVPPQHEHPTQK